MLWTAVPFDQSGIHKEPYLLQNNEIAILILSTILEEEIMAPEFLPQETATELENRSFTVYRLNFSARIKTRDGAVKQVVIEIQKAKFAADIIRFRRYLGEKYKKGFTLEGSGKTPRAIPIISIYFLEYPLEQVQAPVIKVQRNYYDVATGQAISAREEFIESLTHDSADLEDKERKIAGMGQALEEKDKVLEENAKALEEKDRLIAELRKLR